jgi:hypothetical protein
MAELVCNLAAMDGEQRARYRDVRTRLAQHTLAVRELEEGYAFQHPVELLEDTATFMNLERLCCPFFRFTLVLEEESRGLWLHLTGPAGVKQMLREELGLS